MNKRQRAAPPSLARSYRGCDRRYGRSTRARAPDAGVTAAQATPCVRLLVAPVMRSLSSPDVLGVAMSYAKRRAVHGAVREFLVRVLAAAGLATGLLWALQRPAPPPAAACKQAGAQSVGSCFNETLLSTLLPYITAMGIGLVVGAVIGFLISALIKGRPQREQRVASGVMPPRASGGQWIVARYDGRCASCRSEVAVGDRVYHRPRRTVCNRCN